MRPISRERGKSKGFFFFHDFSPNRWLEISDNGRARLPPFFWTRFKIVVVFLKAFGFLVVMSASHKVILSPRHAPCIKNQSTYNSAIGNFVAKLLGEKEAHKAPFFWTNFICRSWAFTTFEWIYRPFWSPTNSCPWKVNRFYRIAWWGLSDIVDNAAHRSHRSSVVLGNVVYCQRVCQKLSLCNCPSFSSMPFGNHQFWKYQWQKTGIA